MGASGVRDVGIAELKAGLADGSILLVDVREDREVAAGMIPRSVSMPMSRFDPEELPASNGRRIVFSCQSGVRSLAALDICQRSGLALNEHFSGGFRAWALSGEPVTSLDARSASPSL